MCLLLRRERDRFDPGTSKVAHIEENIGAVAVALFEYEPNARPGISPPR
jgi:hypothetical protein